MAKVVETARWRPGRCALSKETQGPFIDTEQDIPRYGRVYLSLKWLAEPLRELGYRSQDEVNDILDANQELNNEVQTLRQVKEDHKALVNAVADYLPTPEPEIIEKKVVEPRDPSDEEIKQWIAENGGNHPVVQSAKSPVPGSYEEWAGLYGPGGPKRKVPNEAPKQEANEEPETDDGPPRIVQVHDQDVDLDKVLGQNVGDVLSYCEGKSDEFVAALVDREVWREAQKDRSPRSTLMDGLGYEVEETE